VAMHSSLLSCDQWRDWAQQLVIPLRLMFKPHYATNTPVTFALDIFSFNGRSKQVQVRCVTWQVTQLMTCSAVWTPQLTSASNGRCHRQTERICCTLYSSVA